MNQPQQRKQKRKTTAETQAKVFWYFYSVSEPLSINRFVFAPKQFKDPLKTLSSKDMLIERVTGIMAKGCQFQQTKKSLQNISAVISLSLVHNVLYDPPTTLPIPKFFCATENMLKRVNSSHKQNARFVAAISPASEALPFYP